MRQNEELGHMGENGADYEALGKYIARYVQLPEEAFQELTKALQYRTVGRKTLIQEPGKVATSQYFILEGCFRSYYTDPKGNEQILHFAIENWWMCDYDSYVNQTASEHYIQALENSRIFQIEKSDLEALFERFPPIERLFRIIAEKTFIALQRRMQFMFDKQGEEMLDDFMSGTGPFHQRVPQYMIASYLGFTPEFLSMLRARKKPSKKEE